MNELTPRELWDTDAWLTSVAAGAELPGDPLARLLSAWNAELSASELPAFDAVVTLPVQRLALAAAPQSARAPRRTRLAALGLIVLAPLGSVAAAAAAPVGSVLYPVRQSVFGPAPDDHVAQLERLLDDTGRAARSGDVSRARRDLAEARVQLSQAAPQLGDRQAQGYRVQAKAWQPVLFPSTAPSPASPSSSGPASLSPAPQFVAPAGEPAATRPMPARPAARPSDDSRQGGSAGQQGGPSRSGDSAHGTHDGREGSGSQSPAPRPTHSSPPSRSSGHGDSGSGRASSGDSGSKGSGSKGSGSGDSGSGKGGSGSGDSGSGKGGSGGSDSGGSGHGGSGGHGD